MIDAQYPDIVVGRDRAHVRALLKNYPEAEIISARAFFDKALDLPFFFDRKLRRDDNAPLIFAQRFLRGSRWPVHYAKKFASLYQSCYHGTMSPRHMYPQMKDQQHDFLPIFAILADIDEVMEKQFLVTGVTALHRSWEIIRSKKVLPFGFRRTRLVYLRHLIDLTLLEIEMIKDLSRLGIQFDVSLPLDFHERGINAAVDFSARQLENSLDIMNIELSFENIARPGPLVPLVENLFTDNVVDIADENCAISTYSDVIAEAHAIAKNIAKILHAAPQASIAVVVRSLDSRSKVYKHALERFGHRVRDRKGVPLLETNALLLLKTIFSAKRYSLLKADVFGLMNHPLFSLHVADKKKRATFIKLIEQLAIVDHHDDDFLDRYQRQIQIYKSSCDDKETLATVIDLEQWLSDVIALLNAHPKIATYEQHLAATLSLIEKSFLEDNSVALLTSLLRSLLASTAFAKTDPAITLSDFTSLLETHLATETLPRPDVEDENAVEFLLLPELLGREFDHVFIADISFGRLPQNQAVDPLMDDRARRQLNAIFHKPILRIYLDDPFEPMLVPPRQALEPLWFASAIASAKESVHFSCATRDEFGVEQAPSDFFLWLKNKVAITHCKKSQPEFLRREQKRFLAGLSDRRNDDVITDHKTALMSRKRAFHHQEASAFAFNFSKDLVLDRFQGSLGEKPEKALTPTIVEAFAECRFKGFAKRMLAIDRVKDEHYDVDVRLIGQVAHRSLEIYFQRHGGEDDENCRRERLSRIVDNVGEKFLAKHFIAYPDIFACYREGLKEALFGLIHHMAELFRAHKATTLAAEIALGLPKSSRPPLRLSVEDRQYLIGGRLDRIDQYGDRFVIFDYKLSSINMLTSQLTRQNILTKHFQMPIYLRLVSRHFADDDMTKVAFSFASIKDGVVLPLINPDHPLFDRIFDDEKEDGFAYAIDRIFSPIREGAVLATPGLHCVTCDFKALCRKSESEHE